MLVASSLCGVALAELMAEAAGIEPANVGVKVPCLDHLATPLNESYTCLRAIGGYSSDLNRSARSGFIPFKPQTAFSYRCPIRELSAMGFCTMHGPESNRTV